MADLAACGGGGGPLFVGGMTGVAGAVNGDGRVRADGWKPVDGKDGLLMAGRCQMKGGDQGRRSPVRRREKESFLGWSALLGGRVFASATAWYPITSAPRGAHSVARKRSRV